MRKPRCTDGSNEVSRTFEGVVYRSVIAKDYAVRIATQIEDAFVRFVVRDVKLILSDGSSFTPEFLVCYSDVNSGFRGMVYCDTRNHELFPKLLRLWPKLRQPIRILFLVRAGETGFSTAFNVAPGVS